MSVEATPWLAWLCAAQRLGVAPAHFWRLSFREWRTLTGPARAEALSRAEFEELASRFADKKDD
jgi:hypothetical protein